jgi:hypothetical protein
VERAAADARRWISELAPVVADPETVADERGRLPRDRWEDYLVAFAAGVSNEAAILREKLPALRAALKATRGRQACARSALKSFLLASRSIRWIPLSARDGECQATACVCQPARP